jgi:acyl-CoA thioester hydrolase
MESLVLPGFRHHFPLQVRWGDMDALGHVNNAVFLTYLETARLNYVQTLGLRDGRADRPGLILAKIVIEFKTPLFAADDVHVFTRVTRLGGRSFETEQVIARLKAGRLDTAAQAATTVVVYDYAAGKSTPIPDEWRALVKAYEVAPPQE